ncbi:MAG: D-hexose-6-phosphate mutarotase [Leptolyngbyaceae cyanobacterium MO_188.B28]|nr:D-hexose-6-phosphate mutarotase [Leptolyngbyaceae cyanobacterium MO_188.B28]
MDLVQLNNDYGIPEQVQFISGKGDFPYIQVTNTQATALISVYGGQILSFQPKGESQDLMFVSEKAYYQTGKAIKGGAPICWPWFGPDPEGSGRPNHGFARNRPWQVLETEALSSGETKVTLGFGDDDSTQPLWPYAFELAIEITIGAALTLALVSRNLSDRPFDITQALHTYFTIGDITQTTVLGLDGGSYIDKVDGGAVKPQSGPVAIAAEVDRIYTDVPNELVIEDAALNRRIRIRSTGNKTAVVWNPWSALSAKAGDLEDEDYTRFICVETANAAADVVTVPAKNEYRLQVTYTIESGQ